MSSMNTAEIRHEVAAEHAAWLAERTTAQLQDYVARTRAKAAAMSAEADSLRRTARMQATNAQRLQQAARASATVATVLERLDAASDADEASRQMAAKAQDLDAWAARYLAGADRVQQEVRRRGA